jgi:hypothetical protein
MYGGTVRRYSYLKGSHVGDIRRRLMVFAAGNHANITGQPSWLFLFKTLAKLAKKKTHWSKIRCKYEKEL